MQPTSEQSTLFASLAKFFQEVPVILKDTSGHGYKYADLPAIIEEIKEPLANNNLGFYQTIKRRDTPLGDSAQIIVTTVFHTQTGEKINLGEVEIPFDSVDYNTKNKNGKDAILGFEGMNKAQAYGSLLTYFRRYSLSMALNLVTDKDTDGTSPSLPQATNKASTANDLDL